MNGKQLAAALGLSEAMVSRLRRRGMPVDSAEHAERWRRRNLEPARTKGMRMGAAAAPLARAVKTEPAVAVEPADPLVAEFMGLAFTRTSEELLDQPFPEPLATALRAVLRRMPFSTFRWLYLEHRCAGHFICKLTPRAFLEWSWAGPDDEFDEVPEFDLPLLHYLAAGAASFHWDPTAPTWPAFRICIRLCAVDDHE